MKNSRWLFLSFIILLTACKNEDVPPYLNISGHWIVDHSFYDDCQVSATFTEELLVLSFYSLSDGACEPELYGIQNNALAIQIDNKEDYFNDEGALATELQVSVPERQVLGTLVLTQTNSGLEGSIVSASDPDGLLEPLLEPTYKLSPLSEDWVPLVLGTWATGCDQIGFFGNAEDICELFRFTDAVSGQIKSYHGGTSSSSDPNTGMGPGNEIINSSWHEATFALRHLTAVNSDQFELDMVIFAPGEIAPESLPFILMVSEGRIVITPNDGAVELESVEMFQFD
jgi:hypothetical protein